MKKTNVLNEARIRPLEFVPQSCRRGSTQPSHQVMRGVRRRSVVGGGVAWMADHVQLASPLAMR
eukprot:3881560-Pleurochrysis_carterae.AAC.1